MLQLTTPANLLLESIRIRLDTGCHLRCFFCNSWHDRDIGLTEPVLDSVLATSKLHGATHIAVSGGEPLTSPMLPTTLRAIQRVGLPCHVTTSGVDLKENAATLAAAGVTNIHLSLESLEGKSRFSKVGDSEASVILNAIDHCKDVGLSVEINYLALRGKNWSTDALQRVIDYTESKELDLTVLDLLYSWNPNLHQFHVPAHEIRQHLSTKFGVEGRIVQRAGTIQTEFCLRRSAVRLRDFRARPLDSLCYECASNATHLGLTPPQISSVGTLGFCSHQRVNLGDSASVAVAKFDEYAMRIGEAGSLQWQRF